MASGGVPAAAAALPKDRILCRYFANNVCRNGASCPFSHDRSAETDRVCRYYLAGICFYGARCRYDHVRPPGSTAAEEVETASHAKRPSPVNVASPPANVWSDNCAAALFVDAEELAQPRQDEVEQLGDGRAPRLLCPYYQTGTCRLAERCKFAHADVCDMCNLPCLHPDNSEERARHRRECLAKHEAAMEEAFGAARSRNRTCGICMVKIWEEGLRFGILDGCQHCYCLVCIRQWRRSQNDLFTKKTVRSCPECRTHSDFVIPAVYWVEDPKDKQNLIARYRENTKKKSCKYVKAGRVDDCPFGNRCFYKHQLPDGRVVQGKSPDSLQQPRRLHCRLSSFILLDNDSDEESP